LTESAVTTLTRVLRRRKVVAILCALIVPATALAYSYLQEKEYSASAQLLFRDPGFAQDLFGSSFFTPSTDPDREAATNLRLVSLGVVAARTAHRIGGGLSRRDVSSKVEASSEGQSNVVGITATAASPRRAALLANTFAEEYISFRRAADRRKIDQTLAIITRQLAALSPVDRAGPQGQELRHQQRQLGLLRSLQTGNAELVQRAELPTSPSSPKTLRNLLVGILVGIMLGIGMAFLVDRLDRRLRDKDEIKDIFTRPVLAEVPKDRALRRKTWTGDRLPPVVAETFQMLRANLRYFHSGQSINSVLVASAAPDDGKTTIAWNLAVASAETGSRVLFLEADLRQPEMAEFFGIKPAPGLGELLVDAAKFDEVVHRIPVNPSKGLSKRNYAVDVIPAGRRPPNPADLIESQQMRRLLAQASATYDLVVIDTPPTTIVSDAVPLLTRVTGVLVVVRVGKSTRKAAESLQQQLEYLDAPALGIVLNTAGKTMEPYGYGYLEDDAAAEDEQETNEAPPEPEAETEDAERNWVYNRLTVTGDPGDLNEFVERAEGDVDDETGEPVALDFAQQTRKRRLGFLRRNGASSQNGWHAKSPERKGEAAGGEVVYVFASAPSPPEDWLERVSEEHPELSFSLEFIEEFCEEAAGARWRGGTVVETWEIDPEDAEWVEFADDGKG
jgi:succinoglycan biosynthesis transport protein ExoP